MNKVLGVIVEYNPFHNGHLYHLQKSKEVTGCEYVIGVMSGNYVQRGEPAIINKWARTEIALKNGVDLVIEVPTVYATQSAEGFAKGTVNLLANTGIVTDLVFGSEMGDVDTLYSVAKQLLDLEKGDSTIKDKLKQGISYSDALRDLIDDREVLKGSNNILAVEYLKEILRKDLSFKVSTVKRFNNNYNDLTLPLSDNPIASATALRPQIRSGNDVFLNYLPKENHNVLLNSLKKQQAADLNLMSSFFFNLLIREGVNGLKRLSRVEDGLENRILQKSIESNTINELLDLARSRRYPKSRISRLILHFMLNIDKVLLEASNESPGSYLRVLGCTSKGLTLLNSLKNNCNVPYSLNYNKLIKNFSSNSLQRAQLELENSATNLYTNFFYFNKQYQLEYTQNALILK